MNDAGFDKEYQEALDVVKKLDFTITHRTSIPLFETVIRYLGGLLVIITMSKFPHGSKLIMDLGRI